ncbi:MAG: alpha/beta hydrolase [Patescibacteria group bacterium]
MNGKLRLVVLHGWGHDKTRWNTFRERWQETSITVLDLPGFGEEPLQDANWGIPEYASWVMEKFSETQDRIIILGHSFGGRIAAHIGSSKPSWLVGLILYGAPLLYRPSFLTRARLIMAALLKSIFSNSIRRSLRPKVLQDADETGLGIIYRKVVAFSQEKTLPQIAVPTLFVWGSEDEEAPLSTAREALKLVPHGRLEIMAGAGHNAHIEQPLLFHGIVTRFIKNY